MSRIPTRRVLPRLLAAAAATATAVALLPATAAYAQPVAAASPNSQSPYVQTHVPTLVARATLSADHLEPGPASGALASSANGRTGPWDGQVIPGFSAAIDNGDGTFWAQPDNGFGAKGNSADFLLRNYLVRPAWQTAAGGAGEIRIERFVSYNDRNHVLDFPIVNDGTAERLLTGADFDIESVVKAKDGTFWVGEEFGPFLLHFDAEGTLLEKPFSLDGAKSPQNPYLQPGETPRVRASRGFEALAASVNGRYLYPVVEGSYADDSDLRRREILEFDTRAGAYTGRTWSYQTDQEPNVIGDAFTVRNDVLLLIERDDFEGEQAVTKRVYQVDLRRTDAEGYLEKTLVLDALRIANPHGIGAGDGYGTGEIYSLPVQSFETVVQLKDGSLLIGNDNNYPGNDARIPGTPDDTEFAIIDLDKTKIEPSTVSLIGHRGASGSRPEHTLAAYETAIVQCADYIEPDVVSTKDGVLVARHENEIGGTTDVAAHPEFAARKTTKLIDGASVTGWFTEDFTFAELRTLRAKERLPQTRPANTAFDRLYAIPTLDEVMDLARHSVSCDGRPVGVYPETKHPSYFDSIGLSLEEPLVAALKANGLDRANAPVILQSFETANLRDLARLTDVTLAQLVNASGRPYDFTLAGDTRTYNDLVTPAGLAEIATYADGVGLEKSVMIPRTTDGRLGTPTAVIADAHAAGLTVHGWTFRAENQFLPVDFRSSADPAASGDLDGEIRAFVAAGMDGVFSDHPGIAAVTIDTVTLAG
ncbi:glycerophosphoryl diester phosphodiesterase [Microbacterium trichothecenolyticum]|uniref:esterase-like activity of phytase family protein n=1 Tax=Microbacterium trichothecenolyticum TaxID=69370 RepID=UPI0028626DCA|nr:esterase-like activity of phytase family protein [Microbacterium trichothecenolyticum]MDR7184118.1 glycerophosphoryl diester phosphodiesterase [Microbacterium trichothecenolyticum]